MSWDLNPTYDVLDQLKALLKQAGLPDIRFHDLRHSTATLLLSLGVHPKVVQEILGHSVIGMTLDIYSHVLPLPEYPSQRISASEAHSAGLGDQRASGRLAGAQRGRKPLWRRTEPFEKPWLYRFS